MAYIKFLLLLFCIGNTLFFTSSCSEDDLNDATNMPPNIESPRYYVKYQISTNTVFSNTERIITFTNENGNQKISLEGSKSMEWECIYGPVEKDFKAYLHCITSNGNNSGCNIHARIYICRNNEPFVIKEEFIGTAPMKLEYKIDF